jgi:hypothetical protein
MLLADYGKLTVTYFSTSEKLSDLSDVVSRRRLIHSCYTLSKVELNSDTKYFVLPPCAKLHVVVQSHLNSLLRTGKSRNTTMDLEKTDLTSESSSETDELIFSEKRLSRSPRNIWKYLTFLFASLTLLLFAFSTVPYIRKISHEKKHGSFESGWITELRKNYITDFRVLQKVMY